MAIDYAAVLDRIMPEDPLDADKLLELEGNREAIRAALKERKLPTGDDFVTEIEDAVSARLRFLGV